MADDDDLRDELGVTLTSALRTRAVEDDGASRLDAVRRDARRRRTARVLTAAAAVIVVVAAVTGLVIHGHDSNGVRTINPATSSSTAPRATTSTTTAPATTTTTAPRSTTTVVTIPLPLAPLVVTHDAVGPLRFGVATESDVRALIGAPDASVRGSFGVATLPQYQALGYGCSNTKRADNIHIGPYGSTAPPFCRTVYFLNANTGTLAGFETKDPVYATPNGTKPGMTAAQAEQHEGKAVVHGCFTGIQIGPSAPSGFAQEFVFVRSTPAEVVDALAVDDAPNSVGVLFC